jgi:hypothetical protein
MEVLNIDHETGKSTYIGPKLYDLMDQFGAVVLHMDEEHDLFLLCEHPVTKEWAYHSVIELMQPAGSGGKVTPIGINTK